MLQYKTKNMLEDEGELVENALCIIEMNEVFKNSNDNLNAVGHEKKKKLSCSKIRVFTQLAPMGQS